MPGLVALSSEIRCPREGPDRETLCWAPASVDSSGGERRREIVDP